MTDEMEQFDQGSARECTLISHLIGVADATGIAPAIDVLDHKL